MDHVKPIGSATPMSERDLVPRTLNKLLTATEGGEELDLLIGAAVGWSNRTTREFSRDASAAWGLVRASAISNMKIEII